MIGRERELATLGAVVAALRAGAGSIVEIAGPADSGKSRLVAEVREGSSGVRWLEGRALSFSRTIAYWPLIEIVRQWADITDLDDPLDSWLKLVRAAREIAGYDAGEIVPPLASLLGIPIASELADRVRYLDGQGMRRLLMLGVRRWLEDLARREPVALVLEDVQWIDRASTDVLTHVLPLVDAVPLAVCLVGRDEADAPAVELRTQARRIGARHRAIVLGPLSREESASLAELARADEDGDARSGGLLLRRVTRLETELERALELDVAVRPGFLSHTLTAVADADAALERDLARGLRRGELRERLRLIHARVGECVETLFADRLDELSALLAYHFVRAQSWTVAKDYLYRAADHASSLAADAEALALYRRTLETHEAVLGDAWGPVERAVLYRKMGEALWRRGYNDAAVDYLLRALALLGVRPVPVSRVDVRVGIARELVIHVGRRLAARLRAGDDEDADLRTPARRPGVAEQEVVTIHGRLGWIDYFQGSERFIYGLLTMLNESARWGHAQGVVEAEAALALACDVIGPARRFAHGYHLRAVAMAEESGNPVLLGFAHLSMGVHEYYRGRWDDAIASFERSAAAYRAGGDIRGWGSAEQMIAWIFRLQGRFGASVERSRAIVRVAEDAADALAVAFALHGIAWTAWHTGDVDAAAASLEDVIARYDALASDQARAEAMADLAMCRLRRGRVDEAARLAEDAIRVVTANALRGFNVTRPRLTLAAVRLALMERNPDRASARRAREACRAALSRAHIDRGAEPAARRMWGTWLALRGRRREARAWLENAMTEAIALGAPFETALALAELGARTGDADASERARRLFAELGAHDRSIQ